jgi:hypothetical protein
VTQEHTPEQKVLLHTHVKISKPALHAFCPHVLISKVISSSQVAYVVFCSHALHPSHTVAVDYIIIIIKV